MMQHIVLEYNITVKAFSILEMSLLVVFMLPKFFTQEKEAA
jgi:hypothetical protein